MVLVPTKGARLRASKVFEINPSSLCGAKEVPE